MMETFRAFVSDANEIINAKRLKFIALWFYNIAIINVDNSIKIIILLWIKLRKLK